MKKGGLFFVLFLLFSENIYAQTSYTKFNFEDDYEGEEYQTSTPETLTYDPLEVVNRPIFQFNEFTDKYIALPIARQYRDLAPKPIRTSIHNFLTNISAPFSIVNSIFQGKGNNAMASFSSFLINSTIGLGGLFDVAGTKRITYNEEDLGQTFGHYGIGSGPYLVIPFLGPSNFRDISGFSVEKAVDPLSFNVFEVGGKRELIPDSLAISLSLTKAIDTREGLIEVVDDIRKNSFDVYATIRSAYSQRRDSLINQ